jgi:hypothetical protein
MKKKTKKDFLVGMNIGENSLAAVESGESGIGIFDIPLDDEPEDMGE